LPVDTASLGLNSDEQKSDRTKAVYSIVKQELGHKGEESLQSFCSGCSKAVAARFFLELLQLKTWGKVELTQTQAYDPIMVQMIISST
jgi:chromatin segregation and condensation protein Rec8/ScpA/Scc1 (kleisin family)